MRPTLAVGLWGRQCPFWLGSKALSGLMFGDSLNGHCPQPKALEGGPAFSDPPAWAPLTGRSAYPVPHRCSLFPSPRSYLPHRDVCFHQPWMTHIGGLGRGSTHTQIAFLTHLGNNCPKPTSSLWDPQPQAYTLLAPG